MMLVILLAITVFIISVISIVICKVKAWTMRTPESLPDSLVRFHIGEKQTKHWSFCCF